MSDKDMESTSSEPVSKRKFLKKTGAAAGAITSASLVKRVKAEEPSSETISPDSCSTEVLRDDADMSWETLYCNFEDVGGYSQVKVNLVLSDDPNGDDWGDFKANMDAPDTSCDGPWDQTTKITDSGHAFYFDNPTGQLTIQVHVNGAGTGTFDLELEKCR